MISVQNNTMTINRIINKYCILFICLLLLHIPTNGRCQQSSDARSYTVGPGDIISLTIIAGGVEQAKADLVVSEQGEVTLPFIGNINAAGMTLKNLEKELYIPLEKDFFVDPQVNIQIKEYHSLSFTISGAVSKPGKFELDFHPSLLDLIAQAGGVSEGRGGVAYIIRDSQGAQNDPIHVDLARLLDEGDMSQNIMLETNDKVHIPLEKKLNQTKTKVFVEGEIKKPGLIDFQPGLTALSACIMAGGFDKYAAPGRSWIIRLEGGKVTIIKINLDKIQEGKIPDVSLKPGDRIHIPESWL